MRLGSNRRVGESMYNITDATSRIYIYIYVYIQWIGTACSDAASHDKECLNFQVLACCSCEDIVHVFTETVLEDMMHGSTEKVSNSYSWYVEALNTDSTAA